MKPPPVLALETAVDGGSLALLDAHRRLISPAEPVNLFRAEEILPAIYRMLSEHEFVPDDIGCITVSAGPGSFTGIRIGLSTASGLGRGLGIPVYTYSLMKVLAAISSGGVHVAALVPMGRDAVCIQEFEGQDGDFREITSPRSVPQSGVTQCIDPEVHTVAHGSLADELDRDNVTNAGFDMAGLIASHFRRYGPDSTSPIFVSKN